MEYTTSSEPGVFKIRLKFIDIVSFKSSKML